MTKRAQNTRMEIVVRKAHTGDLPAILDIYNYYVLNTTASYDYEARSMDKHMDWYMEHDERHPIFVAEQQEAVIGWTSINAFSPKPGYDYTGSISIYVHVDNRDKRIGSILLEKLISEAKALQYRSLLAIISADNQASLRFHSKFGFVQEGLLKEVGFKHGRWLDVSYMRLAFSS